MLHALRWRIISYCSIRSSEYQSVISFLKLNFIAPKESRYSFESRVASLSASFFKFWFPVSPKFTHVTHKTLRQKNRPHTGGQRRFPIIRTSRLLFSYERHCSVYSLVGMNTQCLFVLIKHQVFCFLVVSKVIFNIWC